MNQQIDEIQQQPVSDIQLNQLKIEWVERDTVHPNHYNPNKMTYQDRMLLRQSILEDGWTQPIVTLPDGVIVDGEQRWTIAGVSITENDIQEIIDRMELRRQEGHPESESILNRLRMSKERLAAAVRAGLPATIASITGGLVPITRLDLGDDAHKMISTIRHNRARGIHSLDAMTDITKDLVQLGLDLDDLETRLGMDEEEIQRFLNSAEGQLKDLQSTLKDEPFSNEIRVVNVFDDPMAAEAVEKSAALHQGVKEREIAKMERMKQVEEAVRLRLEQEGRDLTSNEKDALRANIEKDFDPVIMTPEMAPEKISMYIAKSEKELFDRILGTKYAEKFIDLLKLVDQHQDTFREWGFL